MNPSKYYSNLMQILLVLRNLEDNLLSPQFEPIVSSIL